MNRYASSFFEKQLSFLNLGFDTMIVRLNNVGAEIQKSLVICVRMGHWSWEILLFVLIVSTSNLTAKNNSNDWSMSIRYENNLTFQSKNNQNISG